MTTLSTKAHALIRNNIASISAVPRHPEFASVRTRTLDIDNIVYQSPVFRKIHLEVATHGDRRGSRATEEPSTEEPSAASAERSTYIMHLVLHPHATRALPILSMDVVVLSGRPVMCIADPCPVTPDLTLPAAYRAGVIDLQTRHGIRSTRDAPVWGEAIFSDACILTRGEDYPGFQAYALDLLDFHLRQAEAFPIDTASVNVVHAGHERYRRFQMKNERTRKMLVGAFDGDEAAADAYMEYVFD